MWAARPSDCRSNCVTVVTVPAASLRSCNCPRNCESKCDCSGSCLSVCLSAVPCLHCPPVGLSVLLRAIMSWIASL